MNKLWFRIIFGNGWWDILGWNLKKSQNFYCDNYHEQLEIFLTAWTMIMDFPKNGIKIEFLCSILSFLPRGQMHFYVIIWFQPVTLQAIIKEMICLILDFWIFLGILSISLAVISYSISVGSGNKTGYYVNSVYNVFCCVIDALLVETSGGNGEEKVLTGLVDESKGIYFSLNLFFCFFWDWSKAFCYLY